MGCLQQQCRLADAGIPADKNKRAWNDPSAKNAIELTNAALYSAFMSRIYIYDRNAAFLSSAQHRRRQTHSSGFNDCFLFLNHCIPSAAAWAFPQPLGRFLSRIPYRRTSF